MGAIIVEPLPSSPPLIPRGVRHCGNIQVGPVANNRISQSRGIPFGRIQAEE